MDIASIALGAACMIGMCAGMMWLMMRVGRLPTLPEFWRAKIEHGKESGEANAGCIGKPDDADRRRFAAARNRRTLVDGPLGKHRN